MHTPPLRPVLGRPEFHGTFLAGTFAVRRRLLSEVNGYWEELPAGQHTELGIRLAMAAREGHPCIATSPNVLLTYRRGSTNGIRRDSASICRSTAMILERHRALFDQEPRITALYLDTGGVAASRVGDHRLAREFFIRAFQRRPTPRRLARVALSQFPVAASRVWRRQTHSTDTA
jgi:hypothetical protein